LTPTTARRSGEPVRLLVTRPEPDGVRTAAALRARGHDVAAAALLRVEAVDNAELGGGPWSALVLTSANALAAIDAHPRRAALLGLPVLAVGRRTAAAAGAAGFADVTAAARNVRELVTHIARSAAGRDVPLLYLAGQDRSHDLAAELEPHGVAVRTVVVYRAVQAATFAPAIAALLAGGRLDGVLHFSRRSAEAYVQCARAAGLLEPALRLSHYCLSGPIAEPLAAAGAVRIRVAERHEEAALIDLVGTGP
jgi:uroporphyrinogen-III synthase